MEENVYHITDDVLVKYLLHEATPEEITRVAAWIAADTANEKYFRQFETIWNESKRLAASNKVDETLAWKRFKERVNEKNKAPVQSIQGFGWIKIAALFILVAGAALFAYQFFSEKPVEMLAVQSKQTPLTDTLPDGSVVTLNKNSRLRYPDAFRDTVRAVELEGEAFFNVVSNKAQPFIIKVNDVQVRVLGTSFNIKSTGGNTEVIVETGVVQVRKGIQAVTLGKEEKIYVGQKDSVLKKAEVDDKLYNYYRSREFVCVETPLWKLVDVLNEAYNAKIIIGNNNIRNLPLTTTFRNESLDKILDVVSATFSITVETKEDSIVLK